MVAHYDGASGDTYDGSIAVTTQYERYNIASMPYGSANFGPDGVSGRILSYGIRVTATGPALYRGGEATWFVPASHAELFTSGVATLATINGSVLSKQSARKVDLGRNHSHEFQLVPSQEHESEFIQNNTQSAFPFSVSYPWSRVAAKFGPSGSTNDGCPVGFLFLSHPSSGNIGYRIEVIAHTEYGGPATETSATPSHADTELGKAIFDSVNQAQRVHHKDPHTHILSSAVAHLASNLKEKVVGGGTAIISNELKKVTLPGAVSAISSLIL